MTPISPAIAGALETTSRPTASRATAHQNVRVVWRSLTGFMMILTASL